MLQKKKYKFIASGIYMYLRAVYYKFAPTFIFPRNSIIQFWKIKKNSKQGSSQKFKGKKILFAPIYSFPDRVNVYESLLASCFSEEGANVGFITCSQGLPMCAWNSTRKNDDLISSSGGYGGQFLERSKCSFCEAKFARFYDSNNFVSLLKMSNFADDATDKHILKTLNLIPLNEENYIYRGVNILEHSRASAIRNLLVGKLDLDDEQHRSLLIRYLCAAIKHVDILTRILEKERPDVVCCVHGIYLEHGVLLDLCNYLRIKIVISGVPFKKDCLWFSVSDNYHRKIARDQDFSWSEKTLTMDEKTKLISYVDSKQTGGLDNVSYHPDPIISENAIRDELKIRPGDKIISVFTNTIWDSQIVYKENAFKSHMHWLAATIKNALQKPDYKFIIRIHPAEVKAGLRTNQPVMGEIFKMFKELPDNVILVAPESDISSVDLGMMSEACIIYASKIGIELSVKGKMVIVAGEAICRFKNFTVDVLDESHYESLIQNIESHLASFDQKSSKELAIKWAYHLFYEIMIPFKWATADVADGRNASIEIPKSNSEYQYVRDICEQILYEEKITAP